MSPARFRFGWFQFDSATGELRREDAPVHLQAQPAQVLGCLLARAGQVISRQELCEAVWGAETFVDFERGLNFCIAQVRAALGDDSNTPRFVRTIPRRGYQFIAPVEQIAPSAQIADLPEPPAPPLFSAVHRSPARLIVLLSAACLLLGVAFGTAWWLRSTQQTAQIPIVAIVRFDNETGDPAATHFSDALTDDVTERLVAQSQGRYRVIGNARILRLPREQRDLVSISSSLRAGYVVLGQVQRSGPRTRILAHLIRMPDQTHLWVARMDGLPGETADVETSAAQTITAEFSPRLVKAGGGNASSLAATR
jgi:DNA-binding winged helix-turn-helix (wHTH) protein/TolB-like protein